MTDPTAKPADAPADAPKVDPRDAEIERLRAELAAADAKALVPPVTASGDDIERIPYLLSLACGHADTVDNGGSVTDHYCQQCGKTRRVTGCTAE